jgi:hypothetical protein
MRCVCAGHHRCDELVGWWLLDGACGVRWVDEVSADESVAGCDGWWCGVVGEGVSGVEPGLFEGGLDAGFDFVGDVAVDLDDAFVEAVAESAGLGDFGDAGGDEPGFVAMA